MLRKLSKMRLIYHDNKNVNTNKNRVVFCSKYNPLALNLDNSLAIMQKGEFQSGCYKEAKHAKLSEKRTFLTP